MTDEEKKKIKCASSQKLLRREMELLVQHSFNGTSDFNLPEAGIAVAELHRELFKAERFSFVKAVIEIFSICYLLHKIPHSTRKE